MLASIYPNVKWAICYISEAHAIDEWPISSSRYTIDNKPICIKQTIDLETRTETAQNFAKDYGFDNWDILICPPVKNQYESFDNFELIYKPWPFRIYGFSKNMITFASEPKLCETKIDDLHYWLSTIE